MRRQGGHVTAVGEARRLSACDATHLSRLLPLSAVIQPINLLGELSKVRDDELLLEGLCEQQEVVAHTPARGNAVRPKPWRNV